MCTSNAEGGRRCEEGRRLRSCTAEDLAPKTRDSVPDVAWRDEDLAPLHASYAPGTVCAGFSTVERACSREPGITTDLQAIATSSGARLEGLAHRVKSPSSLVRKIETNLREVDDEGGSSTPEAEAGKLNDVIRYTVVEDQHAQLTGTAQRTAEGLKAQGYTLKKAKVIYDEGSPYKGVHLIVVSPSGVSSEVQVHSAQALAVKERSHVPYEVARDPDASPQDRAKAQQECVDLWRQIPAPPGIAELQDRITQTFQP